MELPESDELCEVLRAVFNLPPSNELQVTILSAVTALPYHGNWQGLVVDEGALGHWFSEDMISSFFLFRLPPELAPVFALERQAPGAAVDSEEEFEFVGLTIVPPGWISANGVIQYLHRCLVAKGVSAPSFNRAQT